MMPEIKFTLDDILKERSISQIELSRLTGIHTQSISNLRKNNAERITLEHLTKIMTALELTDISELLKYIPPVGTQPIENDSVDKPDENPLDDPIEMLDLSPRVFNAIKRIYLADIVTVKDLMDFDFSNSRRFRTARLGAVALKEIEEALEHYTKKHK